MTGNRWDLAVVGAGPAGSTSAALLAQRGYRVVLLDRAHFPRPKPCGEYMSPGVEEVLRRCGMEDAIADALHSLRGMEIVSPNGASVRLEYSSHGAARYARTIPRERLDACLLAHAASQGVDVVEGFVAKEPLLEHQVMVGVRGSRSGEERTIRARLTVVADGSRSVLARRLGLARAPRWPVRMGLVAYYAGTSNLPDGLGQMHVSHGGYCGVAPLPDGLINVAMVVPPHAVRGAGASPTDYYLHWVRSRPRLRAALQGCERVTPVRGVAPIGARAARAWYPGVVLAGDAAGFFDPFTGEGIYQALRGAEMVAQVAHAALHANDVSARHLAPYEELRARSFRWKRGVTGLIQLFVQYPALMEYALPRLGCRPVPRSTLSGVLGDITDARTFLTPRMLWEALRP